MPDNNKGIVWVNIIWSLFFISLISLLAYFQYRIEVPSNFNVELTDSIYLIDSLDNLGKIISQNENREDLLIEALESKITEKIDFLHQVVSLISITTGLFGVLVTAVSIFFSLRESNRVNELIKEVEVRLRSFEKDISSFNGDFESFKNTIKNDFKSELNDEVATYFNKLNRRQNDEIENIKSYMENKFSSWEKSQKTKSDFYVKKINKKAEHNNKSDISLSKKIPKITKNRI